MDAERHQLLAGLAGLAALATPPDTSVYVGRTWIKIAVQRTGFYAVNFSRLRGLSLFDAANPAPFDSLRLFTWPGRTVLPEDSYCDSCDYREVAIGVVRDVDPADPNQGDGLFSDNNDAIYFFAQGPDGWESDMDGSRPDTSFITHPYEKTNFYYLTVATPDRPVSNARYPVAPTRIGAGAGGVRHVTPVGGETPQATVVPVGAHDAYATVVLFDALRHFSQLERDIAKRPDWNIPRDGQPFDADDRARLATEIRADFQKRFWNTETGRFVGWIDVAGRAYDYGFTCVNLEAVHYGLASPEQARSILAWLDGAREVASDTSRGADIYRWRFAPRATTRRNIETYVWPWSRPEDIAWGDQVQDGGAVLGFSFHDLMARLETTKSKG